MGPLLRPWCRRGYVGQHGVSEEVSREVTGVQGGRSEEEERLVEWSCGLVERVLRELGLGVDRVGVEPRDTVA